MKDSIYIFKSGELKKHDNSILFINEDKKTHLPIENIKEIFVFGEVTINKRFLEFLTKKKIILSFFNHYGYYIGSYYPREHYNSGFMIVKQAEAYQKIRKRIYIAKTFVSGSSRNCLRNLVYYKKKDKINEITLSRMKELINKIKSKKNIEELMSIEAQIKKLYFTNFNNIIINDDFKFFRRSRRPPKDSINALISFGNSMMYKYVLTEIYKTHLDPRIAFLHSSNFRSFSLNLDVAEIFKPVIIDRTIFNVLNKNIITKKHFTKDLNGVFLTEMGMKLFIEQLQNKLNQTITHKNLGKKVSYRHLLRLELYKIEKYLIENIKYKPFLMRW